MASATRKHTLVTPRSFEFPVSPWFVQAQEALSFLMPPIWIMTDGRRGGGRLNISNAQPRNASGFSALRIGDGKTAVHRGVVHSIAGNSDAPEHGTNSFGSMMEAAAADFAGQASMRHPSVYMVPSQRFAHVGAGWALVGRVEEDHEVPNVISLKGSSGTRSLPMPALVDYVSRIQELRSFGEEEDIAVSRDSESDFWRFVFQFPLEQTGNLMLMQDGHLRWIWKGDDLAHVGIRFIGSWRGPVRDI